MASESGIPPEGRIELVLFPDSDSISVNRLVDTGALAVWVRS